MKLQAIAFSDVEQGLTIHGGTAKLSFKIQQALDLVRRSGAVELQFFSSTESEAFEGGIFGKQFCSRIPAIQAGEFQLLTILKNFVTISQLDGVGVRGAEVSRLVFHARRLNVGIAKCAH